MEELPLYYLLPNMNSIAFKSGKTAFTFQHDRLRGRLEDNTLTDAEAGDVFEYTLTCTIRNIRLDVEYIRAKLINRRIHIVARYGDGTQRFLPFVRLSAAHDSGDVISARNQYTFRGTTRLDRPAPLIDTALTGGGTPIQPQPPAAGVTPITINTSESNYTYQIPAGKLLTAIWIRSTTQAQTVRIGTTNGGDELGSNYLAVNDPGLFGSNLLRPTTPTNIYFTGLEGSNTIEIWLLG